LGDRKIGSLTGGLGNLCVLTDHRAEEVFVIVGFQGLLRPFADSMGLIVTVQEDKDILKDKRKIFFNRGEGLEKNLEPVVGKEIG